MSAESQGQHEHFLRVFRRRFRDWRGSRPFWAGLFTILGGLPIAYFPYATFKLGHMTLALATTAGAGSLIIGVLLVTLGLTMWFHSIVRVFAGIASILLALVSIPVSNLGGFFIGFLFAMLGGALSVAWVPEKQPGRRAVRRAAKDGAPEDDAVHAQESGEGVGESTTDATVDANGGRNSAG
ncbi:DUF6114 domain-containing protein [Streptomyces sannanensis]|uniref:DUF6114 domain-containing protein n=1 Tax=Streptomyces sannanensis TaxID=285536 RepID=A0ABP6SFU4_9ACTN